MDIKEFAKEQVESIKSMIDNPNDWEPEMAKYILDCMEENGEICYPDMCVFEQAKTRITACSYNNEIESLDLFLFVKANTPGGSLGISALNTAFSRLYSFYEKSIAPRAFGGRDKGYKPEVQEAIELIRESRGHADEVRLFVLTDGVVTRSPQTHFSVEDKEHGCIRRYDVWDMSRVFRTERLRQGKDYIDIDFGTFVSGNKSGTLPCLRVDDENPDIVSYLTAIPGEYLAKIYNEYNRMLLEKNVRTFLRNKSKVNKQIAETLRNEPTRFFAYNNGISATAKSVEFGSGGSQNAPMLKRITDLQIVNGGQTTASIAQLAIDGVDISKVMVQMKINVVKDSVSYGNTVRSISTCANSQTAIKRSDFESGDEFMKDMEKASREECSPATGKKWYFERMRGQYSDERNTLTGADLKMFEEDYPKSQMMTKTDVSKLVMLWEGKPHIGCNSREACFGTYMRMIRKDGIKADAAYYHYIVALNILFKRVDETSRAMCDIGDFVSRVSAYAMSTIAELSRHRLDLGWIWKNQTVQPDMDAHIRRSVGLALSHLRQNPTRSWARNAACWSELKDSLGDVPEIGGQLLASKEESAEPYNDEDKEIIAKANEIEAKEWYSIVLWAYTADRLGIMERRLAASNWKMRDKGRLFRKANVARKSMELRDKAIRMGLNEWLEQHTGEGGEATSST